MPRDPVVNVYDSRWGQDFKMVVGRTTTFSSVRHGLLVIDTNGVDWTRHRTLVDQLLQHSGSEGFVVVEPWRPHVKEIATLFEEEYGHTDTLGSLIVGYFVPVATAFNKIFTLRESSGGDRSGVWCFGTLTSRFDLSNSVSGAPLGLALQQAERLGALMTLDEAGQSTLMVRATPANESSLIDLVARIRS